MTTVVLPILYIDNSELTFFVDSEIGKEKEMFATLLTYTTMNVKKADVIFEAYETTTLKRNEDDWYNISQEYYKEFFQKLQDYTPEEKANHMNWLEHNFFSIYKGFDELKEILNNSNQAKKIKLQ